MGCYNSWVNLRCLNCSPLGGKIFVKWDYWDERNVSCWDVGPTMCPWTMALISDFQGHISNSHISECRLTENEKVMLVSMLNPLCDFELWPWSWICSRSNFETEVSQEWNGQNSQPHIRCCHCLPPVNWYKMVYMGDLVYAFIQIRSKDTFSMYMQSEIPMQFYFRFIAVLAQKPVFLCLCISIDMGEMWLDRMLDPCCDLELWFWPWIFKVKILQVSQEWEGQLI